MEDVRCGLVYAIFEKGILLKKKVFWRRWKRRIWSFEEVFQMFEKSDEVDFTLSQEFSKGNIFSMEFEKDRQ